jgi:hypothetical protein
LEKLFAWTKSLERDDDPIFILRPRPVTTRAEMITFMRRAVGSPGKNVKIIKAETAREWILAADHVITSYSTTLIEAALAGKPIHIFSPEPRPEALKGEWHHLVPELPSREALLEAIRCKNLGATGETLVAWARGRLLPRGDPFDLTAEVIAKLHSQSDWQGQHVAISDYERLWPMKIVMEKTRKFIQRRPALHRRIKGYEHTRSGKVADVFGADDVAVRVSRWRKVREV